MLEKKMTAIAMTETTLQAIRLNRRPILSPSQPAKIDPVAAEAAGRAAPETTAPEHPLCQIITPVGMLGYGFDDRLTDNEIADLTATGVPAAIILDSGSADSGPQKLALGSLSCPRSAYYKDLSKLLQLVHTFQVPLVFFSAGGNGTGDHVREMGDIIKEIVATNPYVLVRHSLRSPKSQDQSPADVSPAAYCFKTISIFSDSEATVIQERLQKGHVAGCGPCVPTLTETDVREAARLAQIGHKPFLNCMDAEPDLDIMAYLHHVSQDTYLS